MVRVLLTGAAGRLGRAAIPELVAAGHDLRLTDRRPLPREFASVQGDIRDRDVIERALSGVDVVVHAAALHGIHLGRRSASDFWTVNASGTFALYDEASRNGVGRVVLASSIAVYGDALNDDQGWSFIHEDSLLRPGDVYGMTKVVAERIAAYHASSAGIETVALRLGMFTPQTFVREGFRLLFGGIYARDLGRAVASAVDQEAGTGYVAFNITAYNDFTRDDLAEMDSDFSAVLERRWPGTNEMISRHGLTLEGLVEGRNIYSGSRAQRSLGFESNYNFGTFLDAWRSCARA